MKLFFLALTALIQTNTAHADSYIFSILDSDPGKIVQAKNCLDYVFCGGKSSELSGDEKNGYRLNAYIDLNNNELIESLKVCNFARINAGDFKILNLNKGAYVPIPSNNGNDHRQYLPLIFTPEYSAEQKLEKFNKIKAKLNARQYLEAINLVITEYGYSTGGYKIVLAGAMGRAGAVTDHVAKTVTFSNAVFWSPCILVQAVRHEFEHVLQFAQVNRCAKLGKSHNFLDHYTRERSAYMNDINNIPNFCSDEGVSDSLVSQFTDFFIEGYFTNPATKAP